MQQKVVFYTDTDEHCAAKWLRSCVVLLCTNLTLLLAVYVLAILNGARYWMLAALLLAFIWSVYCCDIWLVPALKYAAFLKDMRRGLRRSVECVLEKLDEEVQKQDGVRVQALQVRLCDGGDSRIFYLNTSKRDLLPDMGARVKLTAYGRHAVSYEWI